MEAVPAALAATPAPGPDAAARNAVHTHAYLAQPSPSTGQQPALYKLGGVHTEAIPRVLKGGVAGSPLPA